MVDLYGHSRNRINPFSNPRISQNLPHFVMISIFFLFLSVVSFQSLSRIVSEKFGNVFIMGVVSVDGRMFIGEEINSVIS